MGYKFTGIVFIFITVGFSAYIMRDNPALATFLQNVTQTPGRSNLSLSGGLVGHWTFDGKDTAWNSNTTQDKSGQGNTGTMTSMSTSTSPVPGKIGQGFLFVNGTANYINADNPSILNDLAVFTTSFWVKPRSRTANFRVLNKQLGGVGGWRVTVETDGSSCIVADYDTTDMFVCTASNVVPVNTWTHISLSWVTSSNDSGVTYYINGTQVSPGSTQTGSSALQSDAGKDFLIGSQNDAATTLNGTIDDVRIYNRALSAEEVKQLYLQGASLKVNVTQTAGRSSLSLSGGLVGHWTFDGKDTNWGANTTSDKSGQGNTGTMTNMSTSTSPVAGKIGQGFNFDGVNDVVRASGTSFDNLKNTGLAISAWIKPRTLGSGGPTYFSGVVEKEDNIGVDGWWLDLASTNRIVFGGDGTTKVERYSANNTIVLGQWQHVLVTWDGSVTAANIHIYINGTETTYSATNNGAGLGADDSAIDVFIGNSFDNSIDFDGAIDDVRIYNRALSADEVKQLYLQGASLKQNVTNRGTQ